MSNWQFTGISVGMDLAIIVVLISGIWGFVDNLRRKKIEAEKAREAEKESERLQNTQAIIGGMSNLTKNISVQLLKIYPNEPALINLLTEIRLEILELKLKIVALGSVDLYPKTAKYFRAYEDLMWNVNAFKTPEDRTNNAMRLGLFSIAGLISKLLYEVQENKVVDNYIEATYKVKPDEIDKELKKYLDYI